MLSAVVCTSAATATLRTVCSSGCDHTTIQAAVNVAQSGDTIRLQTTIPHTEADIILLQSVTVEGIGLSTVQAAANPGLAPSRVFYVQNGVSVTIRDLTIRHGVAEDGGGIYNDGDLALEDVDLTTNEASSDGGGIYNNGLLTMLRTTVTDNESIWGGGIFNSSGGSLVVSAGAVSSNSAAEKGGGIFNLGQASLEGTEVEGNWATHPFFDNAWGGGIYNEGGLSLTASSVVRLNVAEAASGAAKGGGIFDAGTLLVQHSTVAENLCSSTFGQGAGIHSASGALTTLLDSEITDNTTPFGAGLFAEGATVTVEASTIGGNSATAGAGIYVGENAMVDLVNSTLSGNSAFLDGGGLYVGADGTARLASVTVSDNEADSDSVSGGSGGGVFVLDDPYSPGTLQLRNTLIADNRDLSPSGPFIKSGRDCDGEVASEGYNLIGQLGFAGLGSTTCTFTGNTTGNLSSLDPLLGSLGDHGGPTRTHALLPGSPAIDAGHPGGCFDWQNDPISHDQRYGERVDRCDIGSFEDGADFGIVFVDGFESGDTTAWAL